VRDVVVGAVLLTGWLGGAIATHLVSEPAGFAHPLSRLCCGAHLGGLWLRSDGCAARFAGGAVVTTVKSKDGTLIAYDKAGTARRWSSSTARSAAEFDRCRSWRRCSPRASRSTGTTVAAGARARHQTVLARARDRGRRASSGRGRVRYRRGSRRCRARPRGAASGCVTKCAYEPPYMPATPPRESPGPALRTDRGRTPRRRREVLHARHGRHARFVIVLMQLMFWVWPKLKRGAHAPYDAR